jgi:hypothetical protein
MFTRIGRAKAAHADAEDYEFRLVDQEVGPGWLVLPVVVTAGRSAGRCGHPERVTPYAPGDLS